MSIEALWSVKFGAVSGRQIQAVSGGVVVLETGRVFGGDTWTHFTGNYTMTGKNAVTFEIQTGIHFTDGGQSIFGGPLTSYRFAGHGTVHADMQRIDVVLKVVGQPSLSLAAVLQRCAELP